MDKLLTAQNVADMLAIPVNTVYILVRNGDIPSVRIGRRVRIRPQDLERYISSNTESTGDEK